MSKIKNNISLKLKNYNNFLKHLFTVCWLVIEFLFLFSRAQEHVPVSVPGPVALPTPWPGLGHGPVFACNSYPAKEAKICNVGLNCRIPSWKEASAINSASGSRRA